MDWILGEIAQLVGIYILALIIILIPVYNLIVKIYPTDKISKRIPKEVKKIKKMNYTFMATRCEIYKMLKVIYSGNDYTYEQMAKRKIYIENHEGKMALGIGVIYGVLVACIFEACKLCVDMLVDMLVVVDTEKMILVKLILSSLMAVIFATLYASIIIRINIYNTLSVCEYNLQEKEIEMINNAMNKNFYPKKLKRKHRVNARRLSKPSIKN